MYTLLLILVLIVTFIYYKNKKFSYWKEKNVEYFEPSLPFGNFDKLFVKGQAIICVTQDLYKEMRKRGVKFAGYYLFFNPVFLAIDIDLIKRIMQVDFATYFSGKPFFVNARDQPISSHLFVLGGERWRLLRQKLTPTFTSGKIKMMFNTLIECRKPMLQAIEDYAVNKIDIDIKELAGQFTTDVIGSVAFGIECNSFSNPNSDFRKYGKEPFETPPKKLALIAIMTGFPDFARFLKLKPVTPETADFFERIIADSYKYRKDNNVTRNDFLQLLINLKETGNVDGIEVTSNKITFDEMVAQSFVFFIAGFETSSTTAMFCMFELCLNQDIQEKVREEINRIIKKYDNEITYEGLQEMTYLKQVIHETLRKYPPLPLLDRICTADYQIPGTDVILEAGTPITIPVFHIHNDPEHYPDPEKFDPERFTPENVANRHPYTYLPFGEGPRICIALRFGMMMTQILLITLLKDYKYKLNPKTKPDIVFEKSFVLAVKGDVHLDVEKV